MRCSNCNHENPDNLQKCENCGTILVPVTAKLDPAAAPPPQSIHNQRTDPLDFSHGENFGNRYQIIEEIGQGGMGKVFKARDLELDIVVALKMIKPELSSDPEMISRFKRELLLAREILHENVIRIHDLGEINGIRYISMNFIDGNSLQEIIQSTGKLTIEKSIDIARQVCNALEVAHKKGIVHRDLKPQNIMIDKKGNAYVLDFGIARSISSSTGETEAGIVLGTPDFMSPEQIRGKSAEATSDIYSLGIILYEMVTGQLPFKANSPTALLYLHLNEEPVPPSKLNPQLPKKLEKIILKCMAKKKRDRYHSVAQVREDLELRKTGEIKPINEPDEYEEPGHIEPVSSTGSSFFKSFARILLLLIIVYAVVSVLSLVNDANYKVKLDKIKVEDEVYYKNLFPLSKTWLPSGTGTPWDSKNCNACETYNKLFPPQEDEKGQPIPHDVLTKDPYIKNILDNPGLKEVKEAVANPGTPGNDKVQQLVERYGKHFNFDELFSAVRCKSLDPSHLLQTRRHVSLPLVELYTDMLILEARDDFAAGLYQEGVDKLTAFTAFTLDLLSTSTGLAQDQVAAQSLQKICREIIPLLLSMEGKVAQASPGDDQSQVEEERSLPQLTADEEKELVQPGSPTKEETETKIESESQTESPGKSSNEEQDLKETTGKASETGEPGNLEGKVEPQTEVKGVEEIEKPRETTGSSEPGQPGSTVPPPATGTLSLESFTLLKAMLMEALEKLEPQAIYYKEYLGLVRHYETIDTLFKMDKRVYYGYGKLLFWKHGFSINRYFFNRGVDFYQGLFDGLKYIRNPHDKSTFIHDYFYKHDVDKKLIPQGIPGLAFTLDEARFTARLILILLDVKEYGIDSKYFSELKATEIFINDLSGQPFEITETASGWSILLDKEKNIQLNLSTIPYLENFKAVFNLIKQLRSIPPKASSK